MGNHRRDRAIKQPLDRPAKLACRCQNAAGSEVELFSSWAHPWQHGNTDPVRVSQTRLRLRLPLEIGSATRRSSSAAPALTCRVYTGPAGLGGCLRKRIFSPRCAHGPSSSGLSSRRSAESPDDFQDTLLFPWSAGPAQDVLRPGAGPAFIGARPGGENRFPPQQGRGTHRCTSSGITG